MGSEMCIRDRPERGAGTGQAIEKKQLLVARNTPFHVLMRAVGAELMEPDEVWHGCDLCATRQDASPPVRYFEVRKLTKFVRRDKFWEEEIL